MNTIYLLGDSTCQTNDTTTFPQKGWGQYFKEYINSDYTVVNLAKNGRSSLSFKNEGLFNPCLKNIKKGDFLFIQFGHNDEKSDVERHTDPFTTYQETLKYYIDVAKKVGATPVLLSSIYRRHFKDGIIEENCHGDYPEAMRRLAKKENVIYIDMCEITKKHINNLGDEKSKELFMNFPKNLYTNYPEGSEDNSHLRETGARTVCSLIQNEIRKNSELKVLIK